MTEGTTQIRALGVGDLLDETFGLFRRHFGFLVLLGAVVYLPIDVLQMALQLYIGIGAAGDNTSLNIAAAVGMVVIAFVSWIAVAVVYGAFVVAISALYHGQETTIRDAYRAVAGRFWPLLGLTLLYVFAIVVMMLTVVGIPFAIHFGVAWAMAFQALLLERLGITKSFGRSRRLVRGMWWRVTGIILLVAGLEGVLSFVVGLPSIALLGLGPAIGFEMLAGVAMPVVTALTTAATQIFIQPLGFIAAVLIYYDLRVRKEGYDLELRASNLAGTIPAMAD